MADDIGTSAGEDSQHIPGEKWMPVPSEPGVLASNMGRVLLPPRYAPLSRGGFRAYMPVPRYGQVSRAHKDATHEYRIIMVRRDAAAARQSPRKVHQLVCEAFHGPKPFQNAVVVHLDEDALNNRAENLKWGTQKENLNAPKLRASIRKRPMSAICKCCDHQFEPKAMGQKFCSTKCSGYFNNKSRAGKPTEWRL